MFVKSIAEDYWEEYKTIKNGNKVAHAYKADERLELQVIPVFTQGGGGLGLGFQF